MPLLETIGSGGVRGLGMFGGIFHIGLTAGNPANSARAILAEAPAAPSGLYWINDGVDTFQVYCDMTRNGGGWMLGIKVTSADTPATMVTASATGDAVPTLSSSGKFSDARINRLRSRSQATTNGYTGNWPWWAEATGLSGGNPGGVSDINMFFYKDAQTFESTCWPGSNAGIPGGVGGQSFSTGTNGKSEWRRITNTYNESSISYSDVAGTPNYGTRGFGHHHPDVLDANNRRFAYYRHPEGGVGGGVFASNFYGVPTNGYLWIK
jgi:hypothetical protein